MSTVYVLVLGEYDETRIGDIFVTRELAERSMLLRQRYGNDRAPIDIQEWEVRTSVE